MLEFGSIHKFEKKTQELVMSACILDRLAYFLILVYFIYVLMEGWNRLTPIF